MSERPAVSRAERVMPEPRYGRDFRLYALGQAVSVAGDRIATIALVFLVIHLSRSYPPALALFYVCRVAPTLLGGLVAGVAVDYFNRRRLLIGCDVGRAGLMVVLPLMSALALWALYPIVLLLYALTLVFETAARAALPDVVPPGRMTGANAVINGIQTGADLTYAVGGGLVFAFGVQLPFYIDAFTFAFSALVISYMEIPQHVPGPLPDRRETVMRIREGIAYLWRHPFLRWSTLTFTFAPLAGGAVFVLAPLYAAHVLARSPGLIGPLHSGAFRFSTMEVCLGAGAVAGSALAARLARDWPRGQLFGLGFVGLGLADATLAFVSNVYVASAVMAVAGAFNSLFVICGMTLLQTLTPTEVRGRVVAARITVINTALAVGSAAGGMLLTTFSYRTLWLILGGVIVASSLFIWLQSEVRDQV